MAARWFDDCKDRDRIVHEDSPHGERDRGSSILNDDQQPVASVN